LTGRPPFKAANPVKTLFQLLREDPVPPRRLQPGLSADLETICLKCLHKDPNRRYQSALELAEDLRRYQDGKPILARPTPTGARAWRWCARRPRAAVGPAPCALLALPASGGGVLSARVEEQRAATAENLRRDADAERQRAQRHFLRARAAVEQMLLRVGEERL